MGYDSLDKLCRWFIRSSQIAEAPLCKEGPEVGTDLEEPGRVGMNVRVGVCRYVRRNPPNAKAASKEKSVIVVYKAQRGGPTTC